MIVPDTKDWTWVLRAPCPECGFDAAIVAPAEVSALLRASADAWREVLAEEDVRVRPRPDRWSPLEYACHVRDVCQLYDERLVLMLTEDEPGYPNWDQDAAAIEARYDQQNPADVAAGLSAAADTLAARFDGVSGARWDRGGFRSDGAHFTVATFAQYFIHDLVHHLNDVTGAPADRI
ncbi:methyltransferase type 12 [Prauserella marina]|uniref:DinB superfamily protein n=1 Tax=Prauserella marina TaxID=530584 RepID=A0A222VJH5_9PSEU|nr:DinB family protein [Prauserella marina]ASR34078.1 methyltransferase type 12 [Prauserella marina]PWV82716.1 DinB family protein [Prauserella marina]SDC75513.1 DinB superfamily protein [Prauserella marina]